MAFDELFLTVFKEKISLYVKIIGEWKFHLYLWYIRDACHSSMELSVV